MLKSKLINFSRHICISSLLISAWSIGLIQHAHCELPADSGKYISQPSSEFQKDSLPPESGQFIQTQAETQSSIQHRLPAILKVGPNQQLTLPSQAAKVAVDGDTIQIDGSGKYENDTAIWRQNDLKIIGVNGRAHIHSDMQIKNGKALWIIQGNNTKIENIEFSGAKVSDGNGAGIRLEGANLIVKKCYFHDNENGILTGKNLQSEVAILNSEFSKNGRGQGKTHNVYIGKIAKLSFIANFSHHARVGHALKSRALRNEILYNRLMDGTDGNASYLIDLPNGGYSIVMGNVIQQGPNAENWKLLSYGAEGLAKDAKNYLYVTFNTFVNTRRSGIFIYAQQGSHGIVANNIFSGEGELLKGGIELAYNAIDKQSNYFRSPEIFDYSLKKTAPFLDKSRIVRTIEGVELKPEYQPGFRGLVKRRMNGSAMDPGAFEYWIY